MDLPYLRGVHFFCICFLLTQGLSAFSAAISGLGKLDWERWCRYYTFVAHEIIVYKCREMRLNECLGIAAALICMISCSGKQEQAQSEQIVKTEKAIRHAGGEEKEYAFIARPFRTSELSFRVSGPIDRFEVYAGNYYSRGSILAEIDPRDFRLRKERAKAVYEQQQAEFHRIEKLYEKDNLSASQYEKAKADYTMAKTAFDMATNELEDTRLVAPFNGYVGEVYIEKFQDVKATQPVLSLIDIDKLRIEVYVTQEVAKAVRALDSVEVRFDLAPERVYKAPITEVSKGTTRNNLSYLLTILLPNPDRSLLAGMSGKVSLAASQQTSEAGIVIPQYALCHRPEIGDFVWIVNEGSSTVTIREVTKGDLLPDGQVCIRAGLSTGETFATSGLRFLSDGMKVKLSPRK